MSLAGTIFTLIQSTLGAGTITLPYAIYANGLVLGPLLMVGAALLSYYTGYLLVSLEVMIGKSRSPSEQVFLQGTGHCDLRQEIRQVY